MAIKEKLTKEEAEKIAKKFCEWFDEQFRISCMAQFKKENEKTEEEKEADRIINAVFGLENIENDK